VGPSRPRSRRADPTPHQCALSPRSVPFDTLRAHTRQAQGTYSTGSGHILDRLKAHTRQRSGHIGLCTVGS
jgi:hypothetical protein